MSFVNVTAQQLTHFLAAVAPSLTPFTEQSTLAAAVQHNASVAREQAAHYFGVTLPVDYPGMQILDDLLNAMHTVAQPKLVQRLFGHKISEQDETIVSASLGAHLAEYVQSRLTGHWGFQEFAGRRHIVLITAPGSALFVLQKAGKQFRNGPQDSVQFFFSAGSAIEQARIQLQAKYDAMSPEEKQAYREKIVQQRTARVASPNKRSGNAEEILRREVAPGFGSAILDGARTAR
jgi:type II secretory pathway pseudopilin PulG